MKFLKGYGFEIHYHPRKANIVADTLSRTSLHVYLLMIQEMSFMEKFRDVNLSIIVSHDIIQLNFIQIASNLQNQIHEAQESDELIQKKNKLIGQKNEENFGIDRT